jgi:hypothetical protein
MYDVILINISEKERKEIPENKINKERTKTLEIITET